jgi:RecA/RadA recombinase
MAKKKVEEVEIKKKSKKKDSDFFDEILSDAGVDIPVVAEVDEAAVTKFYSTGSLTLNALLAGSMMHGGLAGNKITCLAGEEATGKSFIALQVVKTFLDDNPKGHVFYFDSEDAITEEMMSERGIDTHRVHKRRVKTIQEFRQLAINLIDAYLAKPEESRPPMMYVLDSLGNLSTTKEMADIASGATNKKGEETRDMTRPGLIRGLFRVLTIKLGEANCPMLMTNHTYETMDPYGEKKKMSGGGGLKYAASSIVFLSKKKLRDETDKTDVLGSVLTATLEKSRFTRYGKTADMLLTHDMGLDKYWGLFDLGKNSGLLILGTGEKGNGIKSYCYKFPDGQIATKKEIEAKPATYFTTPDNIAAFEELCIREFRFGKNETVPEDEIFSDEPMPDEPEPTLEKEK